MCPQVDYQVRDSIARATTEQTIYAWRLGEGKILKEEMHLPPPCDLCGSRETEKTTYGGSLPWIGCSDPDPCLQRHQAKVDAATASLYTEE